MDVIGTLKARTWLRRVVICVPAVLVIYSLAGFLILPAVLERVVSGELSARLRRSVTVEKISLNPYSLSVTVRNLVIKDREGPAALASFAELHANYELVSIFKGATVLEDVRIVSPHLNITRNQDNLFNFSDLLEGQTGAQGDSAAPAPSRFLLRDFRITGGVIDIYDAIKDRTHKIEAFELSIPSVSNLPELVDQWVEPTLSAKVNGASISLSGQTRPFSKATETAMVLRARDFSIPFYLLYAPARFRLKVLAGHMDATLKIDYSLSPDAVPALSVTGDVELTDVESVDPDDVTVLKFVGAQFSIASLEPFSRQFHLSRARVRSPEIHLSRDKKGRINIQALFSEEQPEKAEQTQAEPEAPSFTLTTDQIEVADGTIVLSDHTTATPFQTTLSSIILTLDHLTTAKDSRATLHFSAKTEAEEKIEGDGNMSYDPLSAEGSLKLEKVQLKKYLPFFANSVSLASIDGEVDFAASYHLSARQGIPDLRLSKTSAVLRSLKLRGRDETEDFLHIPLLEIKDAEFDLRNRKVSVAELSTGQGVISAKREADGRIDVARFFTGTGSTSADKPEAVPADAAGTRWSVSLIKGSLRGYTLTALDQMAPEPVGLKAEKLDVTLSNFSTAAEGSKSDVKTGVSVSAQLNGKGSIAVDGEFQPDGTSAALKVDLKGVDATPLQSYLPRLGRVRLTGGKVSASGKVQVGRDGDRMRASYAGDLAVADFASVDKTAGNELVKWRSLELKGLDFGTDPAHTSIRQVDLRNFFVRVAISSEKKVNVLEALSEPPHVASAQGDTGARDRMRQPAGRKARTAQTPPARVSEGKAAPVGEARTAGGDDPLKIDKILIRGGQIAFEDNFVKPPFKAVLHDVDGTVSGLSSSADSRADLAVRGNLDKTAPLDVTGKISPLGKDFYADLKISFKDFDLTRIDPYARKYAGYALEKGNLRLELQYLIVKKKLDARNDLVLDQLALGDKVESPNAVSLPLKFAVSLLQDNSGRIQLSIPVTGDIDDPQFSLGKVIGKAVEGLLVKVVTAPFSVVGALLGGAGGSTGGGGKGAGGAGAGGGAGVVSAGTEAEDPGYVQFDFGSSHIDEQSMKKLDAAARLLSARPRLQVDLEGRAAPAEDAVKLREELLETKIRNAKFEAMKKGPAFLPNVGVVRRAWTGLTGKDRRPDAGMTPDQVPITPEEYEKILRKIYSEELAGEKGKKADSGKLSVDQVRSALLERIQVGEEELRTLAREREENIKAYLVNSGKIDAGRVSFARAAALSPGGSPIENSRVVLNLK